MRQVHRAGEKLFVDYAGMRAQVINPATGEVREANIFVAALGASNYTYAEATWTQGLEDWIGAHVRCFTYFGGVPEVVVPDNLRAGVSKAHRYEPDINPTYPGPGHALRGRPSFRHGCVVPVTRRRPEVAVQVVERWILAALRHRQCFSLAELNRAVRALLESLNNRPFKKLPGTRRALFEQLDKPALRPLPVDAYEYAEWKQTRVHIDYHIEVHGHYYSVPHALIKKQVDVRITANTIECFHRGQRIASHRRSCHKAHHTTVPAHMPESHRQAGEWSPQRLGRWAAQVGPATETLIPPCPVCPQTPPAGLPQLLRKSCALAKPMAMTGWRPPANAALTLGSHSYKSLESILRHGLDRQPLAEQTEAAFT